MNNKMKNIVILLLLIVIGVMSVILLNQKNKVNVDSKDSSDEIFRLILNEINIISDYSELSENEIIINQTEIISDLDTVLNCLSYTSYQEYENVFSCLVNLREYFRYDNDADKIRTRSLLAVEISKLVNELNYKNEVELEKCIKTINELIISK